MYPPKFMLLSNPEWICWTAYQCSFLTNSSTVASLQSFLSLKNTCFSVEFVRRDHCRWVCYLFGQSFFRVETEIKTLSTSETLCVSKLYMIEVHVRWQWNRNPCWGWGGGGGCAPFIPKNNAVISQIPDFLAVLPKSPKVCACSPAPLK